MSARHDLHHRDTTPATEHPAGPGAYLTDEIFLYRVTRSTTHGMDELVELEDCYRLDVVQVPITDLRARWLRVVTPSAPDA